MYNYVGPSWAQKSFDPLELLIEPTNFAKQWQLLCIEQIFPSSSVDYCATGKNRFTNCMDL